MSEYRTVSTRESERETIKDLKQRITELEALAESRKCCGNCKFYVPDQWCRKHDEIVDGSFREDCWAGKEG